MAIEVTTLERVFEYKGVKLPDPGPTISPEEVKGIYSSQYPELASGTVSGPETKGDKQVYTFVSSAGTKG